MAAPLRIITPDRRAEPFRFAFTKRGIERLQPGDRRRTFYDTRAAGLSLRVSPTGHKAFYVARRMEGRFRRVKVGDFPGVTIEQARKLASRMAGQVADGKNPAEARRVARDAMTFGDLFNRYLTVHAKRHKRTWAEDERQYDRHLKRWASRRLDQIKRQDVEALHGRIGNTAPVAANRVLALLSKVYSVAGGMGYAGDNPAKGVQRFGEQARERFLDENELPRFLAAVEADDSDTFRDYFHLLLFTGQRRENVASVRWDEIDLKRRVWTIPAAKFKTGQAVDIPLVPQAVAILESRRDAGPDTPSEHVFPSRRSDAKVPHLAEPKGAFSRVCKAAGIRDLRLHDLRRTVASWATMQGVPYPVVARMVGHKVQGVTGIYARFDLSAVRDGFERTVNAMLDATASEGK